MSTSPPDRECDQCGAQMVLVDSWSTKSPPLIGSTIEYAEYSCEECGAEALLHRKNGDGWTSSRG